MFGLGFGEIVVIAVLALLLFGPDKLPGAARDASRMLKQLRDTTDGAKRELNAAFGPELQEINELAQPLRDLDPRRMVGSALDLDATTGQPTAVPPPAAPRPPGTPAPYDTDAT